MSADLPTPSPASEELFAPIHRQVELCYQTFGDPDDEPLLLIMGLGGPMTWWDPELCRMLAERGFFVIRYDNRDTGRSTKVRHRVRRTDLVRGFATGRTRTAYTMSDLASDAVALLDHLDIEAAHLAGVSMGGMIAQTVAIEHPARALSLTSIMSTTGKRTVGWQSPQLIPMLVAPRTPGREAYVKASDATWALIGSPDYPSDSDERERRAGETFDRGFSAGGVMRQMLAIVTQPDRTPRLRSLAIPASVVHGMSDRMVHVSGGRATAAAIPGADLVLIRGMGHDLPRDLFATFADTIRGTADRIRSRPAPAPERRTQDAR